MFPLKSRVKLKRLHSWNAWIVVWLALTGLILYFPNFRGATAMFRTELKLFHILLGFLSLMIFILYLPSMSRHLKRLQEKIGQRWNLGIVLFLLIGWGISGILLTFEKTLPSNWSSIALIWHDLFSWLGIPYAIYHSVSRSRWIKRAGKKSSTIQSETGRLSFPFSRRSFLRSTIGSLFILAVGPYFYRWVKSMVDNGGQPVEEWMASSSPVQRKIQPLPQSNPPIGGGATGNFRVYTVTEIPSFSPEQWTFHINGLVDHPKQWNWEEFLQIPRSVQVSDFYCVTGWTVNHVTWEGIPLKKLLNLSGVKANGKFVKFYSGDGVYTDGLSFRQAHLDDVMVAVLMDGKPIPESLGGPVRLIVPQMYAYKSVKWLQGIELVEKEHLGFWEVRGYDNDAWLPGQHQKI